MWRDRPYLGLIVVTALLALPTDFFLVGAAYYAIDLLDAPRWVPGTCTALLTVASAALSTSVLHATRTWSRTTAMAAGAWCSVAWAVLTATAVWLPPGWVGPWLVATTLLLAAGGLLAGPRANALAEAAAPAARRGRHLAAFQYAFTAAGLGASLLVSAYDTATWLPWALVAAAVPMGALSLPALGRRLPAAAAATGR